MPSEEEVAASTPLAVLRRQFLHDLAWPAEGAALCNLFGMPPASDDVATKEQAAAAERMKRFATDDRCAPLLAAAHDMTSLLQRIHDPSEQEVWLLSFALASVNFLEEVGVVEVKAP